LNVLIASYDNSKRINFGGKHVHQELLEMGLKQLGVKVETLYPDVMKASQKLRIALTHPLDALKYLLKYPVGAGIYKDYVATILSDFRRVSLDAYDVVHAQDVLALSVLPEHRHFLLTLHGYVARETVNYITFDNEGREEIFSWLKDIEKNAVARAEAIVTVDSRLKQYVTAELSVPEEKITVIYNAVDTLRFVPVNSEEQKKIRTKLHWPADAFVVLIPRRLVPKNGVVYAARAVRLLPMDKFFFVFVGEGPEKEAIREIVKNQTNVRLLDPVPNSEMVFYYQGADVVLIPSVTSDGIQEASSLSMLEGMSCGKVVVCSNIGGMKEIVEDGVTGLLVEEKSPEAIAEKLLMLESEANTVTRIGEQARRYAEENHSYLRHAEKFLELYAKLLNG